MSAFSFSFTYLNHSFPEVDMSTKTKKPKTITKILPALPVSDCYMIRVNRSALRDDAPKGSPPWLVEVATSYNSETKEAERWDYYLCQDVKVSGDFTTQRGIRYAPFECISKEFFWLQTSASLTLTLDRTPDDDEDGEEDDTDEVEV